MDAVIVDSHILWLTIGRNALPNLPGKAVFRLCWWWKAGGGSGKEIILKRVNGCESCTCNLLEHGHVGPLRIIREWWEATEAGGREKKKVDQEVERESQLQENLQHHLTRCTR